MGLVAGMGYNEKREQGKGFNGVGMGWNEKEKEQQKGYNGWNGL